MDQLYSVSSTVNIGDVLFTSIFILLVVLMFVSFAVCMRTWSKNQQKKIRNDKNVEQKLDKIIALLEKKDV